MPTTVASRLRLRTTPADAAAACPPRPSAAAAAAAELPASTGDDGCTRITMGGDSATPGEPFSGRPSAGGPTGEPPRRPRLPPAPLLPLPPPPPPGVPPPPPGTPSTSSRKHTLALFTANPPVAMAARPNPPATAAGRRCRRRLRPPPPLSPPPSPPPSLPPSDRRRPRLVVGTGTGAARLSPRGPARRADAVHCHTAVCGRKRKGRKVAVVTR